MKYEITKVSYIGGQLRNPGEIIEVDEQLSRNVAIPLDESSVEVDVVEQVSDEPIVTEPVAEEPVVTAQESELEAPVEEKAQESSKPKGKRN